MALEVNDIVQNILLVCFLFGFFYPFIVLTSCSYVQIAVILQQAMEKSYSQRVCISPCNIKVDKITQHILLNTYPYVGGHRTY